MILFRFIFIITLISSFSFVSLVNSETTKVSRKDELILEGIIHDYFHRNKIKQNFVTLKFEAFATVSLNDIIITVHVDKNDFKEVEVVFDTLQREIQKGIESTILDFPDFEWARDYKITINLVRPCGVRLVY